MSTSHTERLRIALHAIEEADLLLNEAAYSDASSTRERLAVAMSNLRDVLSDEKDA